MLEVPPKTIVVYADITCPWAHVAVYRLHAERRHLGLDDDIRFDIRSFPLELFNEQPTPKKILDAEISVAGALAPDAGWQMWQRPDSEYPTTSLPALEAVEAAKEQGLLASEQLDRRLRVGFFGESRVISLRHEILALAAECDAVDVDAVAEALDSGRARSAVIEQKEYAERDEVRGSPHVFLPDGTGVHNPGIDMEWHGEHGEGFPIVTNDRPEVYRELIEKAAS
ncbi:MAG: DsbA family protein [Actinobacteria bacterium]|nr:DsbA family protein [Actinomycetota bacterium]